MHVVLTCEKLGGGSLPLHRLEMHHTEFLIMEIRGLPAISVSNGGTIPAFSTMSLFIELSPDILPNNGQKVITNWSECKKYKYTYKKI